MKKLIVFGIVAVMLMAMGVVAQATTPAWVVSVAATSDMDAVTGQSYASIGLTTLASDVTGTFATGSYAPTKAEVDYDSSSVPGTQVFNGTVDRIYNAKLSTSDPGIIPGNNQETIWYFQATNTNADAPMYVTAWNLSTANYKMAAGLGYSVSMYELTGQGGSIVANSGYTFTNGVTAASYGKWAAGTGVSGTYNQWTIGAGVNNVEYFEIVAQGPIVPTPEPGSLVALFSGLVGLVGYGIRRRK